MESLPLLRAILKASTAVTSLLGGDIHCGKVRQGDPLPNVVLFPAGTNYDSDRLSHSGPSGLLKERVRICARAETIDEAVTIATAIDKAVHGYSGTVKGAYVNQISKEMTEASYDDEAAVQRAFVDVSITWNRAP